MTGNTKRHLDNIVDTLTCDDGGGRYAMFKSLLEEMDKRAEQGDEPAKKIIEVVVHFSRLIDIANKPV